MVRQLQMHPALRRLVVDVLEQKQGFGDPSDFLNRPSNPIQRPRSGQDL